MAIYTRTPNGWEAIAQDAKAVSSFGSIVPDGNQTGEGTYTDDLGREWVWYEWGNPGDWSFTTDGGLLWVLCVNGGNGPHREASGFNNGRPGDVMEGFWEFDAGSLPIQTGRACDGYGEGNYPAKTATGSKVGDYGSQTWGSRWGDASTGLGAMPDNSNGDSPEGYRSNIRGTSGGDEFSTALSGAQVPGRSGYTGVLPENGTVIIATVTNGAKPKPVQPALTPATIVSAPVVVESDESVAGLMVRDLQDKRKMLYILPGSVNDYVLNRYSVELTAGRLRGLMIASGGTSGSAFNTGGYGAGGGAGGCVGWGRLTDIYIPVDGTYTFTIGGHNPRGVAATAAYNDVRNGQNSTLTGPGGVVSVAVGGGHGGNYTTGEVWGPPGQGGSGGGGYYVASNSPKSVANGTGIPGQGFDGSLATSGGGGGGGAGGFPPGVTPDQINGGPGINVFDLLEIDPLKDSAPGFAAIYTDSGFIGGGGGGYRTTTEGGIGGGGKGWYAGGGLSEADRDGKDMMGAGGGGGYNTNAVSAGGCGLVVLVQDV